MKFKSIMFAVLLAVLCVLCACANDAAQTAVPPEQLPVLKQAAITERDRQLDVIDKSQRTMEVAAATHDVTTYEKAKATRDEADRTVRIIDKGLEAFPVIEQSVDPGGRINVAPAAVAIGGLVGGPLGAGIAIGGSVLASLIAGWQMREKNKNLAALKSLVNGLDYVSARDSTLSRSLDTVWHTVETQMTPRAVAVVNAESIT